MSGARGLQKPMLNQLRMSFCFGIECAEIVLGLGISSPRGTTQPEKRFIRIFEIIEQNDRQIRLRLQITTAGRRPIQMERPRWISLNADSLVVH